MNNETYLTIPDKLKVGFGSRDEKNLLCYLTYINNRGEIAKENSWNGWRNKDREVLDFDNTPIDGITIMHAVGGYKSGWNYRKAYCQIHDPRGFEVQITFENLVFILSMMGYDFDGVHKVGTFAGKFVYAWNGTELVLCPVDSDDYKHTRAIQNTKRYQPKECQVGHWYKRPNDFYDWMFIGAHKRIYLSTSEETVNGKKITKFIPKVEKVYVFTNGKNGFQHFKSSIKGELFYEVTKQKIYDDVSKYVDEFNSKYSVDRPVSSKIVSLNSFADQEKIEHSDKILTKMLNDNYKFKDSKNFYYLSDVFNEFHKNLKYSTKCIYRSPDNKYIEKGTVYVERQLDGMNLEDYKQHHLHYTAGRYNNFDEVHEKFNKESKPVMFWEVWSRFHVEGDTLIKEQKEVSWNYYNRNKPTCREINSIEGIEIIKSNNDCTYNINATDLTGDIVIKLSPSLF